MTAARPLPPRSTLLVAGRWVSQTAVGTLKVRRHLGDTATVGIPEVHVTAELDDDPAAGVMMSATMTAESTRRSRRALGTDLAASLRLVRPIGVAPGIWRAPAMITLGGVTDLVKVDVTFAMDATTTMRPSLGVAITMAGDAAVFGLTRRRGFSGPLTLRLRGDLAEPSVQGFREPTPWAYAA